MNEFIRPSVFFFLNDRESNKSKFSFTRIFEWWNNLIESGPAFGSLTLFDLRINYSIFEYDSLSMFEVQRVFDFLEPSMFECEPIFANLEILNIQLFEYIRSNITVVIASFPYHHSLVPDS